MKIWYNLPTKCNKLMIIITKIDFPTIGRIENAFAMMKKELNPWE